MRWFFPSFYGDFRLEQTDKKRSVLIVEKATLAEKKILKDFLKKAHGKDWCETVPDLTLGEIRLELSTDVATSGKMLLKFAKPKKATLTAVKSVGGAIEVVEGTNESAITQVMKAETVAAASVSRPTLCCPTCEVGDTNLRASEVLQSFMTPEQHERWAAKRQLVAVGNLTGHRYLVSHRNTKQAAKQTKICLDLDDNQVLHFHDSSVPPEEEVLATKLILEHKEHWLRNEASLTGRRVLMFKNPFGGVTDGVDSAQAVSLLGAVAQELMGVPTFPASFGFRRVYPRYPRRR